MLMIHSHTDIQCSTTLGLATGSV